MIQGFTPGTDGLLRIGRTEGAYVRHGPQSGQMLDGLMGRTIFAQRDRIVSEDEDHRKMHQGGQTDWFTHVVVEGEERRTVRTNTAMCSHPVADGSHRMLAYTEVEVALFRGFGLVRACFPCDIGVIGVGEVSRAANKFGDCGSQGSETNLGMLACSQTFVVCGVSGQFLVPTLGEFAAQHALKFCSFCGVFAAVGRQGLIPLGFL